MLTDEQYALIVEWQKLVEQVEAFKKIMREEVKLRRQVFEACFPDPEEGTNTFDLAHDWKLKGVYKIGRRVDEAALDAVKKKMRKIEVNPDKLIRMQPSLVRKAYNELTEEQRMIFDQALIIKPETPALTLVPPKEEAA